MVTTDYQPALSISPAQLQSPPEKSGALVMPELAFGAASVDPRAHVHAGTGLYTTLGWVLLLVGIIAFAASTMGFGLLALVIAPIAEMIRAKRVRALIRGSGVHIGPDQLPTVHRCVEQFARRLGMKEAPEVYVVEDALQNGVAMKIGRKNIILLTDDVIWGALQSRDPQALGFVLGHELAHVALGHTGTLRSMIRQVFRPLGRADEFTADNVALALIGNKTVAVHGLTVLTVGPQLLPYVNDDALMRQAREVFADKQSKKAEKNLTHPLLLRRIANVLGMR